MQVNGAAEARLRALYDEHATALLGFALRLTGGDRGRAEDVVQDTLVRAWQNRAALDGAAGSIRPWLFTVARRIAIDQHRRRNARPQEVTGTAGDVALMSAADSADVEAGLDRIVVLDALSALSPDHRDVIVQTYYAGRTVAEAAQQLGVPVGTVKSRSFYALKALRLALAERGVRT
ncbi:sigma-70 family RNA polymerase sigma factor [Jatrophihabitans endophyticus]|uniref:sigma-70 family RNA polymerase sigma factor n=1 Tax=Jatrophihabitans endophyticus TaxID=1206085 RepID=UPI0034CD57F5